MLERDDIQKRYAQAQTKDDAFVFREVCVSLDKTNTAADRKRKLEQIARSEKSDLSMFATFRAQCVCDHQVQMLVTCTYACLPPAVAASVQGARAGIYPSLQPVRDPFFR